MLQPGERVVIASGIYRECVWPARGGTSPAQMISYEAAPGAKVIVKGSEVLKDGWVEQATPTGGPGAPGAPSSPVTAWRHDFTSAMFPDAYQPFALPSIRFLGYGEGDAKELADLETWRRAHGWDTHSVAGDAEIDFDPDTLELTMASRRPLPTVRTVNRIDTDIVGQDTGETRAPGPIANPGEKRRWKLDPRSKA